MKGIDIFCASQASTAICVNMEKSSVVLPGGRAIDRHNYHITDARRSTRGLLNPSSSSSCSSLSQSQPPTNSKAYPENKNQKKTDKKRSAAKAIKLISPPGSSRYLLGDTSFFDVYSDFAPIPAWVPTKPSRPLSLNPDDSPALKPSSSNSSTTSSSSALKPPSSSALSLPSPASKPSSSSQFRQQVVVLRVSLHCKGCAGKVRKHISRMEGVTSFTIDFATKKVTVIGDVTPLDVLASVSRVKNAQFWPSTSPPPPLPSVGSSS
ncbi:protein SODIUM POTASSIUM ROOT DEFECTIVE 1-like [Macadamia integrifolia]|uniref:protein SODIUM POTASSIUM ROOT DEFECTIVE 1-like n=1 Tax=Macadamia integrifolia TaxID=60698 RepID=UPI001C4FE5EA|nr:protein SODIUM POTASSIUM ROOT DEFECTIVE 1-like [Macadamia integrifolia]